MAPKNFSEAKKSALILFQHEPKTFYCQCPFDSQGYLNLKSCHYQSHTNKRIKKIEFEHIVPAHRFGHTLDCWAVKDKSQTKRMNGRKSCQKQSLVFNKMEADLHNLVPVIGEINEARSNYAFTEFRNNNQNLKYGACDIVFNAKRKLVQPSKRIRGSIARAYLYMSKRYQMPLNKSEIKLFNVWNKTYPPEKWEIEWNQRVAKVQGNFNTFISN